MMVDAPGFELPRFIAVEGPIRVGKTTLADLLAERLHAERLRDDRVAVTGRTPGPEQRYLHRGWPATRCPIPAGRPRPSLRR